MHREEIERFLLELGDLAAAEILPRFRSSPAVRNKAGSGFDPVTDADAAAERAIRNHICRHYPDHGIVGEEEEAHRPEARYCWIVDPIDGTRAFIAGLPSWGTLIGLTRDGEPVAGLMHQPFTGEKFLAAGNGAFLLHDGTRTRLSTRRTRSLADSILMTTSPFLFAPDRIERYNSVEGRCLQARYGFDCYAYAMVAAGQIDLVVESDLNNFDIAALIPLIEQAGGVVTDWNGNSAIGGGDIIACANDTIHAQALALLR